MRRVHRREVLPAQTMYLVRKYILHIICEWIYSRYTFYPYCAYTRTEDNTGIASLSRTSPRTRTFMPVIIIHNHILSYHSENVSIVEIMFLIRFSNIMNCDCIILKARECKTICSGMLFTTVVKILSCRPMSSFFLEVLYEINV